jgi:hypothetical protein
VHGPQHAEVPVVERGQLGLSEPLNERKNACVDDANLLVVVLRLNLMTAREIGERGGLETVCAGEQVLQKGDPCAGAQPLVTPIVELGEDQCRHHEVFAGLAQEPGTTVVVGIGGVERCEQRSGVEDECHLRRRASDRAACQIRSGETVGRSRNAKPRTARGVERLRLLVDRFSQDHRKRDATSTGLGLERVERVA